MHAAMVNGPRGPLFYWNLDGAVGKNGANNREDVLFVQWCIYKLVQFEKNWSPMLVGKLKSVGLNGNCNGRDGDPLVEGIKALQQHYGLMLDGRVSTVPKGSAQYGGRGARNTFLIVYPMNAVLAQMHPAQWPRIDLMPEFAWVLKEQATNPFTW